MLKFALLAYAGAGLAFALTTTPAPEPAPIPRKVSNDIAALCSTVTNKAECEETLSTVVACANAGSAALRRECEEK